MRPDDLLAPDERGIACPRGGFHVDPWLPVPLAVVTHGHGDHARPGSERYVTHASNVAILRARLGTDARIDALVHGEELKLGDVVVSLHPAGHVLGSAQVRVNGGDATWVVSGDYKRDADPTCAPFEPVRCDVFVTEATFGLPIFRWPDPSDTMDELLAWWDENRARKRASVLFCYALGKAQRVLAELATRTDRGAWLHGSLVALTQAHREAGVAMIPTQAVNETKKGKSFAGELVLAPPSAGGPWMRRFGQASTGFASGFMAIRGNRRRRSIHRGFVLSDHADWPALLRTIDETGASRVITTHGHAEPLARWLREGGRDAEAWRTSYGDEETEA